MIPADLAAFRALMERAHNVASDRCIGPRCCGDLCESLHALATATPAQLCGIAGEVERINMTVELTADAGDLLVTPREGEG